MKLINIDTARRIIDSPRNKVQMLNMLEQTPTVDAVEVIRCKDCIYYDYDPADVEGWCDVWENIMLEDAFCSCAERRQDG